MFEDLYEMMLSVNKESLDKSLADCHVKGCFSLVVAGTEHGNLTRVFIATKKIKPFDIQFHSHRYGLRIGVIHGVFEHHVATNPVGKSNTNRVSLMKYIYKSPLNGGDGLTKVGTGVYDLTSYYCPVGSELVLSSKDIHSVSVSKGAMWVVQELGFQEESSTVLGTNFSTEGLYNEPKQFQVNNMYEQVLEKLNKLV